MKRPCKNCYKLSEEHFPDHPGQWIKEPFWCFRNGRDVYTLLEKAYGGTKHPGTLHDDISFREMDNLAFLEWKSK